MTKLQIFVAWLGAALAMYDASAIAFPERESNVILYVDDDAPQGGDGSTWQSAFRYLQDALAFAADPNNGVSEIRVAQGTYKPDQGAGHTPGNRDETFQIPSGIALLGGYAGLTGKNPDERNWQIYESILSGDLIGNDPVQDILPTQWTLSQFSDNSRHVVTIIDGTDNRLEGVTVASGFRQHVGGFDDIGTGLFATGGSLDISSCIFRGNWGDYGGGLGARNCNAHVQQTTFKYNRVDYAGGGIDLRNAQILVEECLFNLNYAITGSGGGGGGVVSNGGTVRHCNFVQNRATMAGSSGGLITAQNTIVEDCVFSGNSADYFGAATGPVFTRCEFEGNSANNGGAIPLGGLWTDCVFRSNTAHDFGGAAYTFDSVPTSAGTFIRCTFQDNLAFNLGGGAIEGGTTCINCLFLGNDSWMYGGGAIRAKQNATLVNCILDGNKTRDQGGAIRVMPGISLILTNSTILDNTSQQNLGGIAVDGQATINNSVIWGNQGSQVTGNSTLHYSCVQGGWNGPGAGNISNDPVFRSAVGSDGIPGTEDDDLRLSPTSPCIDAGDNSFVPQDSFDLDQDGDTTELISIDLLGLRRFRNDPETPNTGSAGGTGLPIVDMGAFEFQPLADINADGIVNVSDLLAVINAWGPCPQSQHCLADIAPYPDGDGTVNFHDLLKVVFAWGQ